MFGAGHTLDWQCKAVKFVFLILAPLHNCLRPPSILEIKTNKQTNQNLFQVWF